jgi:ABC-2 type transport system permease protein/sodium transport system permease protein
MTFHQRIRTVYRKELLDILRDRRTLIAMIVVPIVLYPLLMVGSIQAVSYQAESLEDEKIVLGVVGATHKSMLADVVVEDAKAIARAHAELDPASEEPRKLPKPLDKARVVEFANETDLREAVRSRHVHVGVSFREDRLMDDALDAQNHLQLFCDQAEFRSESVAKQLREVFDRVADGIRQNRIRRLELPKEVFEPFVVDVVNLSAPSSILGQILPLILVLMTITGAIYPAIDLTAGERERGTLETLMVCPVPVLDLIVGKFLVVTTVAILGAALNLASVSATVYFGGFQKVVATVEGGVPIGKMAFILLALIPFAVLMSAIMIAVCSFARTFKEAQNYVTPVIFAVLIPGGFAALPTARLEGIMLVMPVGNMVLLARDVLLGAVVPTGHVALVLLSTSLYAAAAVAVAANLFGQEAVLFSDVGSLKTLLSRRFRRPAPRPSVSMALFLVAMLFPAWFFLQSFLSPGPNESATQLLRGTTVAMPVFFVLIPAVLLGYLRVDLAESFALRLPRTRFLAAAILTGATGWVLAHELTVFQYAVLPLPPAVMESLAKVEQALTELTPAEAVLYLAVIPAVCEELLFRGMLLSGLSTATRTAAAIVASAAIFGVFHFVAFKFVTTFALGLLLAFLCRQSGSILPGMVLHFLHNGLSVSMIYWPWRAWLGLDDLKEFTHLPINVLLLGALIFTGGVFLARRRAEPAVLGPAVAVSAADSAPSPPPASG